MEWTKVRTAADCTECAFCEEPFCEICNDHYADCNCIGPSQEEEFDYKTDSEGVLWAIKRIAD